MIRRTTHSLKFATNFKENKLNDFFQEYERVVNEFIDMFWSLDKLPSKINSDVYHKIDSWLLGTDIKRLLAKLNRKTQGSKRYERCLREIKHYISYSVNQIDFSSLDLVVMEDLTNITKNTKGRTNKQLRKQLGHWNIKLVFDRIVNKCELNRVWFELVNPQYTSQTCSRCQIIDKTSRKGEVYDCSHCGSVMDADTNASINILNRFLDRERTVPYEQKEVKV